MKISKLFHWLYGFLMLLPIFAVGVKCAYVTFNKNAFESYTGSYNYFATQNINTYLSSSSRSTTTENSINGNTIYKCANSNLGGEILSINSSAFSTSTNGSYVVFNVDSLVINNVSYPNVKSIVVNTFLNSYLVMTCFDYRYDFNNYYYTYGRIEGSYYRDDLGNIIYEGGNYFLIGNNTINNYDIKFVNVEENVYYFTNFSTLKNFEKAIFFTDTNLSSVFYSSLDELDDVSFFSWARYSFLSAPFMYIGAMFGIPDVHPIFTFLSYWCAISIIYLVFDLIMYIPLLAHRWIDKGIIE